MDTNELKNMWQAYDARLEKSLTLNARCIEAIQSQKVKSAFTSLRSYKIYEMALGLLFLFALGKFLYANQAKFYFVAAAGVLMLFCVVAIIGAVKQIALIAQTRYDQNIIDNQKKLTMFQSSVLLQTSIIKYLRLLLLSLPFYTAYIIIGFKLLFNIDIVTTGDHTWWIAQIILSLLFVPVSLWLYGKISINNMHIKWVRTFIESAGGKSIGKALRYIKELDEFEKDLSN
jgi:hypothetical protein